MLRDSLYVIETSEINGNVFTFRLNLTRDHPIFKGHFPGQPVLPGACMLQVVKELTERAFNKKVLLKKADNLKFLAFVDPLKDNRLDAELNILETDGQIKVTARFENGGIIAFKFSGVFMANETVYKR